MKHYFASLPFLSFPPSNEAGWLLSLLVILSSYMVGCFTAGYYLVRLRTGADIRAGGSGSAGATNVSRALGKGGFLITLALDAAKGALVAWAGIRMGLTDWALLLAMLAVIGGHIRPVQLGFRGGKGVATFLGVLLVADFPIVLLMAGLFIIIFSLLRRFSASGLAAMAAAPAALAAWSSAGGRAPALFILVLPVLFAHSDNIREEMDHWRGFFAGKPSAGRPREKE